MDKLGTCRQEALQVAKETLIAGIAEPLSIAVACLLVAVCACICFKHGAKNQINSPGLAETQLGSWVRRWVGPHVHESLVQSDIRLRPVAQSAWYVNASPFHLELLIGTTRVALRA